MSGDNINSEDVFKILLATDCHLGFMEHDAVRGSDSVVTFEEILQIAVQKNVDFILLGGDLFHDNKPSRKTMHQCMTLLRKYCMGDRPIQFQFLSDQSENFKHCSFPVVNYEDPNLNISLPVFSIHGNHDDPAGYGTFCSLDLLSISGFINYFGKCVDLDNVEISPLLFQKGCTKLALYGLGSIRDERLHRLFREGKVNMLRPRENSEEWFNLFTLHQNRAKHGATNYIPEQFLDNFLDLVLWGHEHECRLAEEWNSQQSFYVTQPGSSVATSLCHGEAVPKNIGLLEIHKKTFKITEIPLRTVRQFYITDIDLEETSLNMDSPDCSEKTIDYCREKIESLLAKAEAERSGHARQPEKPLIRLRVFHPESFDTFSVQRFGQGYVDRVANPKDTIQFTRKKKDRVRTSAIDADALKLILRQEGIDKSRVEDLVKQYFLRAEDKKKLFLLSENGVGDAVQKYVDKEENEAIQMLVNHQLTKVQTHLQQQGVEDEMIDDEIQNYKNERQRTGAEEQVEFPTAVNTRSRASVPSSHSDVDNFDDETQEIVRKPRGRGRGRGSRGGRGNRKSNGASANGSPRKTSPRAARNASAKSSSWVSSGKQTSMRRYFGDVSDVECIDDSEGDPKPTSKQKRGAYSKPKGVVYGSDSEDSF